ncbi:MAG: 3-mercaptopyruvate sulfurtransferase [Hyphomicrobiaceae bacterium]|nr:3-mercaptopyruvate sulfurtransferase [Hyphomicrobiaceae bacterium]
MCRQVPLRGGPALLEPHEADFLSTSEPTVPLSSKSWIVDTQWLADRLDAPGLVVLDGTWHLPTADRDARAEYLAEHIPGALFFDIDDLSDEAATLPHMLPSQIKFASRMKKLGVGDGMKVVVYDSYGLFSAARVWWTFRAMGHNDVAVLDGGLKKWKAEGRPVDDGQPVRRFERHFTPRRQVELIRDFDEMRTIVTERTAQVVDARSAGRFAGTEPEPRPGLRGGHMPGARSVPATDLIAENGTLKPAAELARIFEAAGVDPKSPVVTTCGSGVTASIVSLALAVLGQTNAAVYDGSWAEWGQPGETPVVTGPPT